MRASLHQRWFGVLGTIYLLLWAWFAVAPADRPTWALENLLTVVVLLVLFASRRSFPFSLASYALWFVFLTLHAVGAHFMYSQVPYDRVFVQLIGWSPSATFGWERNNYDRVVHFAFGLLLVYPAREIALRIVHVRGFWGYFVPFLVMVSFSAIFELFEWFAALLFGEGVGVTYLGTQGDPWDAQKDVALASLGALIALGGIAAINRRLQRDFGREWAESLRVKRKRPLDVDRDPGI